MNYFGKYEFCHSIFSICQTLIFKRLREYSVIVLNLDSSKKIQIQVIMNIAASAESETGLIYHPFIYKFAHYHNSNLDPLK